MIECKICGHATENSLQLHLNHKHQMNNYDYHVLYPGATIYSTSYGDRLRYTNANRDPSYKAKLSANTLRLFQDPEWTSRHNEASKQGQNTEAAKENHKNAANRYYADRSEEEKVAQKQRAVESWGDEQIRANRMQGLKIGHNTVEAKEHHSEATKKFLADPVNLQERKEALKKAWAKPENRAKLLIHSMNNIKHMSRISKLNTRMKEALNNSGLHPKPEQKIGRFFVDFLFEEEKFVVEVDGDYWHANPLKYKEKEFDRIQLKTTQKDLKEKEYCENNDYFLLRFWETDINRNIAECVKKVEDTLCKLREIKNKG